MVPGDVRRGCQGREWAVEDSGHGRSVKGRGGESGVERNGKTAKRSALDGSQARSGSAASVPSRTGTCGDGRETVGRRIMERGIRNGNQGRPVKEAKEGTEELVVG